MDIARVRFRIPRFRLSVLRAVVFGLRGLVFARLIGREGASAVLTRMIEWLGDGFKVVSER